MDDEPLALTEAARRLGVHYQTAYKWVRSGRLPATVVRGRYAVDPADLAAFAERRARPAPPPGRRPRGGFVRLADRLFRHLVAGEEGEARRLVADLTDAGVAITTVAQEVLSPAMARVGREWRAGQVSIWQEHRATAIVQRLLGAHHPNPRGRRRGTVAVAAPAGDHHVLPTAMAAAALRDDNWHVHHLGADVPDDELVRFVGLEPVDLVVLTVTTTDAVPAAEGLADRLGADGTRVLVGAPGARLEDLQRSAREEVSTPQGPGQE
jgi:excisionase family DNA binding protein